ncbi:multiple sugar transport system substrate-binding protein [Aequitasia blattaphilus]|uniref:Sugar ABC transporter substrate-binding protein n=1 Tax=Aequitasia blattaphilus TaxID=2949332 RepID=A0ABT1EF01_9FIRM|nr:sugar ABC transporter substrate-binding protein [Aequitasia blattaphilus]MCP1103042.1 sugar ABC transporter substrate-binding protein [Aequitasia blattaphilus]MCR8615682.1 sugar ABC transporter substrate-binding protein [Aequitasia blattaphilus]
MKNNIVKKLISLSLVTVMSLGLLVGCGPKSESGSSEGGAAEKSGEFDWRAYEGTTIEIQMVQHTASEAMVNKLEEFEELTGIQVEYSITPESSYFDKVSTSLASGSGSPDLFMSGAYQLWDYSASGYVEDLTPYLENASMVSEDYDADDFVASAVDALKWSGVPGEAVGSGQQLGLPLAFEVYTMAYNKKALEDNGLEVPKTYDELLTVCDALQKWNGENSYAVAVRGARDWGTIHPAYMSMFSAFGGKDFEVKDDKLVSEVNSKEAIEMTEFYVDMIKRGGSSSWSKYTWYDCGVDLGTGNAAIVLDADNNPVHQNWDGASEEAGNIAYAPLPVAKEGDPQISNYWTWSIAMNSASQNKGAAWYYIMYFTSKEFAQYATIEGNSLDPARTSVWESDEFKKMMESQPGYIEAYEATIENTTILFTPQPYFFETTTEWAATLQDIVAGKYSSAEEGLNQLKTKMDKAVEDIDLSQY